nr:MAG TPA: hypothetical protein [Caudoviricetes sp.]
MLVATTASSRVPIFGKPRRHVLKIWIGLFLCFRPS